MSEQHGGDVESPWRTAGAAAEFSRGPQVQRPSSLPIRAAACAVDGAVSAPSAPPIPWFSLQSRGPIPAEWLRTENRNLPMREPPTAPRMNDLSLFLGCPDCRAPLTVRRWLMSADCWQCGATVVVSVARSA